MGDEDDAVTLDLSSMHTSPLTTIGAFIERNLLTISSRSEKMKLRDNGGGRGMETREKALADGVRRAQRPGVGRPDCNYLSNESVKSTMS